MSGACRFLNTTVTDVNVSTYRTSKHHTSTGGALRDDGQSAMQGSDKKADA